MAARSNPSPKLEQLTGRLERLERVASNLEVQLKELEDVVEWHAQFHPIPKVTCPHCGRENQSAQREGKKCDWCQKPIGGMSGLS